jgi:hypothetical protein
MATLPTNFTDNTVNLGNHATAHNTTNAAVNGLSQGGLIFDTAAYGVVGDGITDNSAALTAAANAAGLAGGGTLLLPIGTVLFNSPASLAYPNISLAGRGMGATIVKSNFVGQGLGAATGRSILKFHSPTLPTSNVIVRDFSIDLNFQATGGIHFMGCEQPFDAQNILIENVEIYKRGVDHAGDLAPIGFVGGLTGSSAIFVGMFNDITLRNVFIHSGAVPTQTDQQGTSLNFRVLRISNVLLENVRFEDVYGDTIHFVSTQVRGMKNFTLRDCKFINTIGEHTSRQHSKS